jgi:3-phytase
MERKMWSPRILLAALFITIASSTLVCLYPATASAQASSVVATTETDPVGSIGDAADDAAVWVNAFEPSLSTVIGTDNESGLSVYDLDGTEIQHLPDGKLNNVDIRYRFPLAGQEVALVTAGERSANLLAVYRVDPVTRELEDAAARRIVLGIAMNGCCMYRSPVGDEFYFFGNSKAGEVEQWRLFDDGAGMVDAELVRSFDVGGQVEGCAADD